MLPFCEPGDSYSHAWVDGGVSRCFLQLLGSITCGGVLLVLGLSAAVLCPKPPPPLLLLPLPPSLLVTCSLCFLLCLTYMADLVVKGALHLAGDAIFGYTLVVDGLGIVSWLVAMAATYRERHSVACGRLHGLWLVLFWLLSSLWLSLQLLGWASSQWWWELSSRGDIADLSLFCLRVGLEVCVVLVGVAWPLVVARRRRSYSLLLNADVVDTVDTEEHNRGQQERREGSFVKRRSKSAFADLWLKCKLLFPYVWPRGQPLLQLRVVVCFLILVAVRVINVYVPIYYKKIVDGLTSNSSASALDRSLHIVLPQTGLFLPLASVLLYVLLRFLQGGSVGSMGVANNLRSFLWIRVQQYTSRRLQVDLLDHLHSLSLRWHLGRKTGEVLRVMDRGTQSINNLLSYVLFSIAPTLVDIAIAIVYFVVAFSAWFGLIVFLTMVAYILFTISITEWRTKFRRVMNEKDNFARAKAVDSLLNFETVKYYGGEAYEVRRFNVAIQDYQEAEWKSLASLNLLNSGQNVIITLGLLAGASLCAYRVTQGVLSVGDFVLFVTYIVQLYSPLNYFGTYYRMIQQAFVDMENMFDLLEVAPEIADIIGAPPLHITRGRLEFKNVYFHYTPEKPILRDVSFCVEPGQTFALVGPSGAGKSTIIRLLFRFYDIQDGSISLDGRDVREVSQSSVRQGIGVVPQDTVLFNDSILYNIRYGNITAGEEEVQRAASHADIHSRILSFPQRYQTMVGERGLKLSGGEKQRVAIARTILKAPAVILLDEATSALDTETERNIQSSLLRVCEGRTTVIVAHRLSTIIHADQILVLKDGEIMERGGHAELLQRGGMYAHMWTQQQHSLKPRNEGQSREEVEESNV